ncbi:MAG: PilZ domain-containing protein [Deltaproteobacteria bacterium]|nr:MAG: PilZ domain-containing protein [Deltaproteobacteria bacterium]
MTQDEETRRHLRTKIKLPVKMATAQGSVDGVTLNLSTDSAFIRCAKPLRLNEEFELVINVPDRPIKAKAEVVWSNIYGPDDELSPRGMGVRFLSISSEDRKFIAKLVLDRLKSEKVGPEILEALQTIVKDSE